MFRRAWWWILGLVLVGAGLAIALSSQAVPSDFGWFAYVPLDDDSDGHISRGGSLWHGSVLMLAGWQIVGLVVAVIGLVVIAAGVGFRCGRRRAHL